MTACTGLFLVENVIVYIQWLKILYKKPESKQAIITKNLLLVQNLLIIVLECVILIPD